MGEDYSSPQKQDFGQSRYFTPTTKMMFAGLYARLIRNWYVCPDVRLVVAMLKIHCWLDASHRNAASGISPLVDLQHGNDQSDRKSTRLNSSHRTISYAVFCLKKK